MLKDATFCKNCFKNSSSKNCRSYRRFNRKKIADKIASLGKTKSKEKGKEKEIYISPIKRQQIIDDLSLFEA